MLGLCHHGQHSLFVVQVAFPKGALPWMQSQGAECVCRGPFPTERLHNGYRPHSGGRLPGQRPIPNFRADELLHPQALTKPLCPAMWYPPLGLGMSEDWMDTCEVPWRVAWSKSSRCLLGLCQGRFPQQHVLRFRRLKSKSTHCSLC